MVYIPELVRFFDADDGVATIAELAPYEIPSAGGARQGDPWGLSILI